MNRFSDSLSGWKFSFFSFFFFLFLFFCHAWHTCFGFKFIALIGENIRCVTFSVAAVLQLLWDLWVIEIQPSDTGPAKAPLIFRKLCPSIQEPLRNMRLLWYAHFKWRKIDWIEHLASFAFVLAVVLLARQYFTSYLPVYSQIYKTEEIGNQLHWLYLGYGIIVVNIQNEKNTDTV